MRRDHQLKSWMALSQILDLRPAPLYPLINSGRYAFY